MSREIIEEHKRDDSKDYLFILKSLKEIPFSIGKNLLIDFLRGSRKNNSITKNKLHFFDNFGSLKCEEEEIRAMIDNLIENKLIEVAGSNSNKFLKLLMLTHHGKEELKNPSFYKRKLKNNFIHKKTEITDGDRIKFEELKAFLLSFNDEQKKAIISNKEKILCIAGAGSGKTTVLTKRIEFLIKYRGVNPEKILAITFTRKARQEMGGRLFNLGISTNIETFNSFCEKILKKYGDRVYGKNVRVISYGEKIMAMMSALNSLGSNMGIAIDKYFSSSQKSIKTKEQLSNVLMNDCFFILDYFKSKNQELYDFSEDAPSDEKESSKMIYKICIYLKEYMDIHGFRDYTDQMLDCIKFFKNNKEFIPQFAHILVDEYQDVNSMQIELLGLLNPKNLFCVGDPRQSIFGWRGSDIKYILKFEEKYSGSEIIILTKNYRSNKSIVDLMNASIREMNLSDIENSFEGDKEIKIINFGSEGEEAEFIIKKILDSNIKRDEIFVLSRTNRQINELSKLMNKKAISHIVKTDEINNPVSAGKGEVTLATIHSIKGLEAEMVFVIGCNELNFPCKTSDHPVIEMIKIEEYDREEEEKRLFYVAISRAKHKLYLTYTGKKPTYFINSEMMEIINGKKELGKTGKQLIISKDKLRRWRNYESEDPENPDLEADEDYEEKEDWGEIYRE